jgi:hypothetical protein
MGVLKIILGFICVLCVVGLLALYWFFPLSNAEFKVNAGNSNFSVGSEGMESMQFYPNMRYPDSRISYRIEDCTLQKKGDMERAFEILEGITVLNFYPVSSEEEIYITCEEIIKVSEPGLFIAGEGGPTKVIAGEKFNVILSGEILLIKDSKCENPNIAIHELLHALGFEHSTNPNNIMYNYTKCSQTIGDDIPDLLNKLYSFPSYADLSIVNITADIHGRYLDSNITIKNSGLKNSENAVLKIYADEKLVDEIDVSPIEFGEGKIIILKNILISKISVDKLNFVIDTNFNELEKENNKITLEIKN